ncbi:hypothetical protein [Alteraurantiacibacter aquimixticola]|uniref:Uncharacterized protein n=1 Tax=Alteraurantiacibacter aquimixticola TaxID=2489173 RepID=A0A4T3F0C5_9SPHN|nr:hypothetical protein [Alteraurantiacibacter aquimixticola]TIX50492.1 hypothetical protein E5222_09490 [Alteraurantiacibacter aquimixticola]
MMIRPEDDEIVAAIQIAVKLAPNYAIRGVFKGQKLERKVAIDTITQRVFAALGRYEITREARGHEVCSKTLPLFPEREESAGTR